MSRLFGAPLATSVTTRVVSSRRRFAKAVLGRPLSMRLRRLTRISSTLLQILEEGSLTDSQGRKVDQEHRHHHDDESGH